MADFTNVEPKSNQEKRAEKHTNLSKKGKSFNLCYDHVKGQVKSFFYSSVRVKFLNLESFLDKKWMAHTWFHKMITWRQVRRMVKNETD